MKINQSFRGVAVQAVLEGGRILARDFGKRIQIRRKEDLTFLTSTDLAADRTIKKFIKGRFPSHDIVSEESGGKIGQGFTWVIDPLDGTTNYLLGFPFFSISIALLKEQKPILALVFNPISRDLYLAEKGKGAYLNSKRMRVNKNSSLPRVSLSFGRGKDLEGGLKALTKIAPHIRTFRFWGSSNLEICQVANSKIDGYLVSRPSRHDVVPGVFIVEEAGGRATDFNGEKYTPGSKNLIVTNTKIHNQLLKFINE